VPAGLEAGSDATGSFELAAAATAQREGTAHEHDLEAGVPDRLPEAELRRLSTIDARQAAVGIAAEWAMIAAAVAIGVLLPHPLVIAVAIAFIGGRQHALTVIAHDASHYRLFRRRVTNDLLGNLLLAWPMFISVEGFRHFHSRHHRHLNTDKDGNRELWQTHGADGEPTWEWTFPKTLAGLLGVLLFRGAFVTGVLWILRGFIGGFFVGTPIWMAALRAVYFAAIGAALTQFDCWREFLLFWVTPYCTWHLMIQYLRLICEHSAITSIDARYAETRTTIPGLLGRLFILPRNIGYHIEHHWYPSVPFYRLPDLHRALMENPNYRRHARISHSILGSLRECVASR